MTHSIYNHRFSRDSVKQWLTRHVKVACVVLAAGIGAAAPANAANDLLVAPTRLEFDNRSRSTEVLLSNIGAKPATYRISLVVRRMTPDGKLDDVETPNDIEQRTLDMISYAPRRVVLEPNQPQSIRVAVRKPADLADGEYRVHMMFRAVPEANPVVAATEAPTESFAIQLIPIYGITIPVIVRSGALKAEAEIRAPRIERENGREMVAFELARSGDRSTYGEVRVLKPGRAEPIIQARGIAVYTEVASRKVLLPVSPAYTGPVAGPATIQYFEIEGDASRLVSEARVELN